MAPRVLFFTCVHLTLFSLQFLRQPLVSVATEVPHLQCQEYMVQYDAPDQDELALDDFCQRLNAQGINHTVTQDNWKTAPDIIKMATLELKNSDDVNLLRNTPGVTAVTPVTRITQRQPQIITGNLTKPTPGIKVAVIDNGVDCEHPALGGGFGEGKKISFGWDLVGDSYNGIIPPQPKASPCTPCGLHGTHTMGIIGASDVGFGFTGASPNSTLGMYLFGCAGGGSTSSLMVSALLRAYKDGAQVISASVGGIGGWGAEGDVLTTTVNSLARKGVIVVLATGNEGDEGVFYTESPAAAEGVISVGWVQSSTSVVTSFSTSTGKQFFYHSAGKMTGSKLKLYVNSPNTTVEDDACAPLGPQTPSLMDFVILIKRGTCPFQQKLKNVAERGGKRVLIYMDAADVILLESKPMGMELGTISHEDGLYLAEQAAADPKGFTLDFPQSPQLFAGATDSGIVNNASNYGPSYDFKNMQPSLVGVGGNMLSTVPISSGSYVAGVVALVLSARRKHLDVFQMRALLSTTSQLVLTKNNKQALESAIHQGAGLLNAYCAAMTNTLVSKSSLALRDLQLFDGVQSFTITNTGSKTYTYKLNHHPAETLASFKPGSYLVSTTAIPIEGHLPAEVQFDSESRSFELGPGATRKVTLRFTPPKGLNEGVLPIYSGFIRLSTDAECESHTVPYYGVYGVLKKQKYIDYGADTAPFAMYKVPRVANSTRLPVDRPFSMQGDDKPVFRYRLAMGSPFLQMDLVDGNATLNAVAPPTFTKQELNADLFINLTLSSTSFRGVHSLGRISDSNATFSSRTAAADTMAVVWDGKINPFSNISASVDVRDGNYKILLRVMRINGSPGVEGDWEAWLSPVFTIDRTVSRPANSTQPGQFGQPAQQSGVGQPGQSPTQLGFPAFNPENPSGSLTPPGPPVGNPSFSSGSTSSVTGIPTAGEHPTGVTLSRPFVPVSQNQVTSP
ncbi:hypothetical protein CROQUDRAFT_132470 [Cronartium quercuum f. sp. fusiforme G11]|uniref:Rhodanese domain-containing protein n=1 Tax=Cronartium quercuum f. sp. fusiforme G11 TaxID=708437 RepID=A0A9P6TDA5_9BASI|nr:hypothetical protein CROQUDRAFT_132470 [Cronartium quercuum f. sp. fusiforme G11]